MSFTPRVTMPLLTISQISTIAADFVQDHRPELRLAGVTVHHRGSAYSEILLRLEDCHTTPGDVLIGIFRNADENAVRRQLAEGLDQHASRARGGEHH